MKLRETRTYSSAMIAVCEDRDFARLDSPGYRRAKGDGRDEWVEIMPCVSALGSGLVLLAQAAAPLQNS